MSRFLEANFNSLKVPLVPIRGEAPVAPSLMGRVFLCRPQSKAAIQDKNQPILFCAQKSGSEFVNFEDLYSIGVLGLVRQLREESEGIKVIYESLHRVTVNKIYENETYLGAEVAAINDEMSTAKVSDHWSTVKELILHFSQYPISAKWDLVSFAQQDIAEGLEPSIFGEKLSWLCGSLLDNRIFSLEQRQGLLGQGTPKAAMRYVHELASQKLKSIDDMNIFTKAFEFEKS